MFECVCSMVATGCPHTTTTQTKEVAKRYTLTREKFPTLQGGRVSCRSFLNDSSKIFPRCRGDGAFYHLIYNHKKALVRSYRGLSLYRVNHISKGLQGHTGRYHEYSDTIKKAETVQ